MAEVEIRCSIDLPPVVAERLRRLGAEALASGWDGRLPHSARFTLCPVCLMPTWQSSSYVGDENVVFADIDQFGLCHVCEETRSRFPDIFRWVSFVLTTRGIIGNETNRQIPTT